MSISHDTAGMTIEGIEQRGEQSPQLNNGIHGSELPMQKKKRSRKKEGRKKEEARFVAVDAIPRARILIQ